MCGLTIDGPGSGVDGTSVGEVPETETEISIAAEMTCFGQAAPISVGTSTSSFSDACR